MDNITISSDIFKKIFVKNSTIDCVAKDRQIENDLTKLCSDQVTLCFISNYIQKKINDLMIEQCRCLQFNSKLSQDSLYESTYSNQANIGRLGPAHVQFDLNSLIGQITLDRYTNTLMSNSGFSTIKANCFLYSGKFQYEVLLLTKGIMQLGFASTNQSTGGNCNFTLEKGVGDSLNSYSYDGNRQKKWNLKSSDYGDKWEIYDVISCCIDLDNCAVSFYRNGKFLGVAFDKIQTGAGIVYFPAISLAFNERIIVNFGSSRFKYAIDGYESLEVQNQFDIVKSNMLIEWLFNLILMKCQMKNDEESIYQNVHQEEIYSNLSHQNQESQTMGRESERNSPAKKCKTQFENPFFYLTTSLIMEELEILLTNEYIIETCLFKHLILYHTKTEIHCFLDIIWSLLDETNLDLFFNLIVIIIVYGFQFSQFHDEEILFSELNYSASTYPTSFQSSNELTNFVSQKQYLYLFLLFIQHKRTRIYFLNNVLFKKNLFFQLLDTKLIFDNTILQKHLFAHLTIDELNNHFSGIKHSDDADSSTFPSKEFNQSANQSTNQSNSQAGRSNQVWRNIELENSLFEIGTLQNMIIDTLIFQDEFCRTIFIDKFATFLGELERQFINNRTTDTFTTPLSVLLSVFHRLCSLIRNQYENVITCFPLEFFINPKYCSKNTTRIGGIYSHLEKNHQKEISIYNFELSNTQNPLLIQVFILIDHLIKLYSFAVHKQLAKYHGIKELLIELNNSIQNLDKLSTQNDSRARRSNSFTSSIHLQREYSSTNQLDDYSKDAQDNYFNYTKSVLENDYLIKGHQFALLNSIVFTHERQQDIIWLLKIILRTLDQASSSGCIFSYLPHYYLVTCLNLCTALRFYFGNETCQPISSSSINKLNSLNKTQDLDYKQVLKLFSLFITAHFCDERIVNNDHKELITQSLTSLISSKQGLNVLENISIENRINLIKKLTQPFENRSISSNWILLRIWKGSGYAYKRNTFLQLSDNLSNENLNYFTKNDLVSNSTVNPSLVFQQLLCDYFNSNSKQAFLFLTSLLNQLNFSFSEFINFFQEIQNQSIRQDSLKLCCTCYDLSNALLRVLEMIVHYNASLILTNNSITCVSKCLHSGEHLLNENEYESDKLKNYFGILDEPDFSYDSNFGTNLRTDHFGSFDDTNFESVFNSNFEQNVYKIGGKNKDRHDKLESNNEILLQQLCSICNQILNRVVMNSKCFNYVRQQLTNLDSMNEFNILSSVTAILVELIVKNERTRYLTLNLLVNDLNFQISSYLYLIGQNKFCPNKICSNNRFNYCSENGSSNSSNNSIKCSDGDYSGSKCGVKIDRKSATKINLTFYLNDEELKELKRLLIYIHHFNERNEKFRSLEECQEDELCSICYANKKNAIFIPCLHKSCGSCIMTHFLRNDECFFCKIQLEKVQFLETNQVLYPQKVKNK